ncbi:MAG: bifunctional diguanylate cyclase/phosphodiesterase [Cyanobium sp.]|nr:bifunctional diguanylate cyclase/phosphodiesterase [Cyanobium sp.]
MVAASTLASGLVLVVSALQSEKERHELIQRIAKDQIQLLATDHELETRDWASWDATYRHVSGQLPDYYDNDNYTETTLTRIPIVMVLDRQGQLFSSAHWNASRQRIEPLPTSTTRSLLQRIPERGRLVARTFIAMVEDRPHLISLQPIQALHGGQRPAGRLLFARSLEGPGNSIPRQALALQEYHFEPVRRLESGVLGPLAFAVRISRWDGLQPMQITVRRAASERLSARRSLVLLLGLDAALLAGLLLQSYRRQRSLRMQRALQMREQRRLARALERSEFHDPLTGLLNGPGLEASLERERSQNPGQTWVLMRIDLRHFALINNSFGREFGDRVLIALARWLEQALAPASLIARSEGDGFSLGLVAAHPRSLRPRIERLTGQLQSLDLTVDGRSLRLSVSAGACLLQPGARSGEALQNASLACDLAKRSGRPHCQFHGEATPATEHLAAIQRLNQELITALRQRRIALFAQPAWHLCDPDLPAVYLEFLCRIHDPSADRQPYRWSEALVEAATHCGTMPQLDSQVLALSLASVRQLLERHPDHPIIAAMVFAINLTADTLLADDIVPRVAGLLQHEGLDASRICFEITEQAAVRNLAVVKATMQSLRELGIRFALDDFGAGMTSLSHLHDLPLDYVKIDKSFIRRICDDPSSRLTVEFVVQLGRNLGFEVIAEGVEDPSLLLTLRALGVTIAQGWVTAIPALFDPAAADPDFARGGSELLAARQQSVA